MIKHKKYHIVYFTTSNLIFSQSAQQRLVNRRPRGRKSRIETLYTNRAVAQCGEIKARAFDYVRLRVLPYYASECVVNNDLLHAYTHDQESFVSVSEIITLVHPVIIAFARDDSSIHVIRRSISPGRIAPRPGVVPPPISSVIVTLCYKADRTGDGVPLRRGSSVREITAARPGRKSGPTERAEDSVGAARGSLSKRVGVCTHVRAHTGSRARNKGAISRRARIVTFYDMQIRRLTRKRRPAISR